MPLSPFLNSDIYDDYFFYAITIPLHFDFRFPIGVVWLYCLVGQLRPGEPSSQRQVKTALATMALTIEILTLIFGLSILHAVGDILHRAIGNFALIFYCL